LILSANVNRRHLSKGQRAMAVAMLYPEPNAAGRGEKKNPKLSLGFSEQYISQARTVLKWTPPLAEQVPDGALVTIGGKNGAGYSGARVGAIPIFSGACSASFAVAR
jgi:hypothetical protein